jgi:hypothetical protein
MFSIDVLGYVLAISIGILGPTAARLHNTGEIRSASLAAPILMMSLTILYVVSGLAAIFYFSWAHLSWMHIGAFFVAWFLPGSMIGRAKSRNLVWAAFVSSVLLAVGSELLIILG